MARNIRDGLPWSPNLELWDPIIPDFKEEARPRLPTWIPSPSPGKSGNFGNPPQQPLPKLPDFKVWDRLIRGKPEAAPSLPGWIQPPLFPPRPDPGPFSDPPPWPLPQRAPPTHEVDPPKHRGSLVTESRSEPAGGLLSLLHEAMRQGELQPNAGSNPQDAPALAVPVQSTQPERRLVRMRVGDDSRPLDPASLPRVDSANDDAIVRLLSGEPMRHWMMPIFDTRR
jgi:hypothetical protein